MINSKEIRERLDNEKDYTAFACWGPGVIRTLLAEVDRMRERIKISTADNCTCGGSGPGETDCVACAIYHDVFTREALKGG